MADPYDVLGIRIGAGKDEVKEAYRKLCKQLHPDLCHPRDRSAAELRFKEVTNAYQKLTEGSKPSSMHPPPPGTPPNPLYTHGGHHQHSHHQPITFGKYAGYNTELEFYRAWFRASKNSTFMLSMAGLIGVPVVTGIWMIANGRVDFFQRMRKDGLDAVKQSYDVNGVRTTINPYVQANEEDSYIYKHEKYAHLRAGRARYGRGNQNKTSSEATNAEAAPSGAPAAS